jgi:hypothetical protein
VLDLLYVSGTLLFFALTLLYVRGCATLGGSSEAEGTPSRVDEDRSR